MKKFINCMWSRTCNIHNCGSKSQRMVRKEGYSDKVKIYQSKIADELNKIDDYDAVISTTIVPDSIKDKVIQGLPLLNGMGVDQVYDQLKTRLGL